MLLFTLPPFPSCFPMLAISAELVDLLDSTGEVWGTQPVGGGMHPLGEMRCSGGCTPRRDCTPRKDTLLGEDAPFGVDVALSGNGPPQPNPHVQVML